VRPGSEPTRVAVALCDCLASPGDADELTALCASLERTLPDVRAAVVPDLCLYAGRGPALAVDSGATRLVLGTSADGGSPDEIQRRARRAGLDPFAIVLVRLPRACVSKQGSDGVVPRLAAAVARARAFAGTTPDQLRPRLLAEGAAVSRFSLLALPPITYEPVPSVAHRRCLGPGRCGFCVQTCPRSALAVEDGRVVLDKQRCDGCGLCVTACPTEAVSLPGSSLAEYGAQLESLLGSDEPAVLFHCRKAVGLDGATGGWLPVQVPCIGVVTPGWMLQAVARGASAVGLTRCGPECGCPREPVVAGRLAYTRDLLRLLGDEAAADRVRTVAVTEAGLEPPPRLPSFGRPDASDAAPSLAEPAATAEALLRLHESDPRRRVRLRAHRASPLGLVRVRASACTVCGACAAACPTGALRLEEGAEDVVLSYDATACVGCERCAPSCPEQAAGALAVDRSTDLIALARGRTPLKLEALARCRNCGGPIAPSAMLVRIQALLADEEHAGPLLQVLGDLCVPCRGSTLSAGGPRLVEAASRQPPPARLNASRGELWP